jgi:hypothetical protein
VGAMGMAGEVPTPALEAAAPESAPQVAELAMAEAAAAPAAGAEEPATPPETEALEGGAVEAVSAAAPPAAPAAGAAEPAVPPAREAPAAPAAQAVSAAAPPAAPAVPEGERAPAARKKDGALPAAVGRPETGAAQPPGQPPAVSETAAAAPSPREAISPAARAVRRRAAGARRHPPAATPVASAQAAAINPQTERTRTAAEQTVKHLSEAEAREVERDQFKAKLKEAIDAATTPEPKTESEAEKVMKTGAKKASASLSGELARERDAAAGPLKSAAGTEVPPSEQPAPPKTELQPEQVGPPPEPVSAAPVVPAPLPAKRLDYSSDRAPADQLMAENNISKEQLEQGNEPAFGPALEARAAAEEHEATAEARYRQSESQVQDQAQGKAQQALAQGLTGVHGERALRIGQVVGQQAGTQSKSAAERQRITDKINTIKNKTQADVKSILDSMETEAADLFKAGLKRAEDAYEDAFEEAKGGIGTWLTTWGEDWERHIEASLATARREYLREVETAIDEVADLVGTKLDDARQRVDDGRKEVEEFVAGLDQSVRQYGQEALAAVRSDFDAMESEIDQRRDGLIDKLAQQYKASYQRMSAMEEKLREENKSLWQRVYDATVGLVKKIIEFKNMLLGVLARAANVIGDIIAHPIRFLGNLVDGVMLGLKNFMSRLGKHLQKGLMEWLFGALGEAGIQMPETFDLKGILSLVLQVLGLTYDNIRARAVAIMGEPVVKALEQAAEIFKILITEGPAGLWEWIKDKVGDLKSMVLDGIKDFIMEKVIIAGITWIIGLLNPASAFFKACKAIYDIIMFFVTRGSQILALVNAVIDSIAAIAKGSLSVAANAVENALARAIPVVIGFLASLLGLGGISEKIRSIIQKIQAPINKAIDWVINKAVQLVKAAGKLLGFGKEEKTEETDDPEHDLKVQAGLAAIAPAEQQFLQDGKITRQNAEAVAASVKSDHPIFTGLKVVDGGDSWNYQWAASDGHMYDTPSEKAETAATSPFEGRKVTEQGIDEELKKAGYRRPYKRGNKWIIARIDASSGIPQLSVGDDEIITTGPTEDESDRGEVVVELGPIMSALPPHPRLHYFSIDPTAGLLTLGSSLRREALSRFRPRSTAQMREQIEERMVTGDENEGLIEIPAGGLAELAEVEQSRVLPPISGFGLKATAMSNELIDWFVDNWVSSGGWPAGWEVHHVVPTDWGGVDNPSNYAAIPAAIHQDITNWWNRLRGKILHEADAAAAREDGTTAEYRSLRFE